MTLDETNSASNKVTADAGEVRSTNAVQEAQPETATNGTGIDFGATILSGRPIARRNVEMGQQSLQIGTSSSQVGPNNMQMGAGNVTLSGSGSAAGGIGKPAAGIGAGKSSGESKP